MNIRLLDKKEMDKFAEWLNINHVHLSLWRIYVHMPLSKSYIGLEKRDKEATDRDKFFEQRSKIRPKFYGDRLLSPRLAHYCKAEQLLNYILKRKSR
jgi:hypothetical protein